MAERVCTLGNIDAVLSDIVGEYVGDVAEACALGVRDTTRQLKRDTQAAAPVADASGSYGVHRWPVNRGHIGNFRKSIAYRFVRRGMTSTGTWYVKAPDHRLTHLLVHGHAKFAFGRPVGGRTAGNPFLHDAVDRAELALGANVRKRIEAVR